jgi:hypothetical protein
MSSGKTNFQIVNVVLDQLLSDVKDEHGDNAKKVIHEKLEWLSSCYGRLWDKTLPPIYYAPAETRFAYVYTYVAAHADFVYQVLNRTAESFGDHVAAKEKAIISCVGGGPGSELVGFLQFLTSHENSKLKVLTAYLLDREQAWADCWTEIGEHTVGEIHLQSNFQSLDVTDENTWNKQKKFFAADFFLMSYFASEISRMGDASAKFWAEMSSKPNSGSLMLVMDSDHSTFNDFVEEYVIGDGWNILKSDSVQLTPSGREQTSDMQVHIDTFKRSPRLRGRTKYWVLQKK